MEARNIGPNPNDKDWIDKGTYWLNILNQGSDGWKTARRNGWGHNGKLLTASNFGLASGHAIEYRKPESLSYEMITGEAPHRTPQELALMNRGTVCEQYVRQCYELIKEVRVVEVGLAIPKFDIRIGGSPDGLVGDDGCIEIKCPREMYKDLLNPEKASLHPKDRIRKSHYDQMIGIMAILGRSWCDYCVCDIDKGSLYIERVIFDREYWEKDLYPNLVYFMDVVLKRTIENIATMLGY